MTYPAARAASFLARRVGARQTTLSLSRPAAMATVSTMNNAVRNLATLSGGEAVKQLAESSPHRDVIRYEHKNRKWTFKSIEYYADALAIGFLETGIQPGDVVLSWLPDHFSETMVLQFACSKAGLVLYSLDPAQAITDPEGAKKSLAKALEVTKANIFFTQEAGDDVNYIRLFEAIVPEVRIFDFNEGMPFITPRFPHLRFPIHTGFEIGENYGMVPLKHMIVPSGNLDQFVAGFEISGSTPLMGELTTGSDGLPAKGKVLTNDEVVKTNAWPVFTSVLKKEYKEIEGVGVVW